MSTLKDFLFYEEPGITLYCGDCREVLPLLDRQQLIVTDPPYGVGIPYPSFDDSREDYWDWMRSCVALMRSASGTVVFSHRVTALRELTGWDWIGVWNKPGSFGARVGNSALLPHWEPLFFYGIHNQGVHSDYLADVLTVNPEIARNNGAIGREKWRGLTAQHPCPKPLQLNLKLLKSLGPDVLDPFAGSGTTLEACKVLGGRAIGIEIEPTYCEIAVKRLRQEVLPL